MNDPTVEPLPSEKHCKRDVLNIVGLQLISRDTSVRGGNKEVGTAEEIMSS